MNVSVQPCVLSKHYSMLYSKLRMFFFFLYCSDTHMTLEELQHVRNCTGAAADVTSVWKTLPCTSKSVEKI